MPSSRVRSYQVLILETRHPTDGNWWGVLTLDPAGKTRVHVRIAGKQAYLTGQQSASCPFVELDELQEMIDRAREQCASMGFVE